MFLVIRGPENKGGNKAKCTTPKNGKISSHFWEWFGRIFQERNPRETCLLMIFVNCCQHLWNYPSTMIWITELYSWLLFLQDWNFKVTSYLNLSHLISETPNSIWELNKSFLVQLVILIWLPNSIIKAQNNLFCSPFIL